MLELGSNGGVLDGIMESAPDFLNKVKDIFSKKKDDAEGEEAE